ncbi:39S ribosomal protein L22, mitochondrial [Coemansia nantahalensis]|uniref:39S ribosomal protein L22, mitochondrial n=1 Tax=Coemansia nantahalensis TaxID=2789366 RepID=A0ACC1K2H4_9FUNG|nr:39S ribosomal protein L22, mitochondrial [Coemansia nantahalensis]KAJ2772065.1 39S ribosomal protein L22, mitochondrial [Coemansia nantahalensis]
MLGLIRGFDGLRVAGAPGAVRAMQTTCRARAAATVPAAPKFAETGASAAFDVGTDTAGKGKGKGAAWKTERRRLGEGTAQVREATFKTDNFQASPRKLRMIANQITGLPIGEAIRQMRFSAKRASVVIKNSLEWAQAQAIKERAMDPANMHLKCVRVGKGRYGKKLECKGRGRTGIIRRPTAHMMYVVSEKHAEIAPEPRNALERAMMAGSLPRRKARGFKLAKNVWTPLDERKPVINPKPYYNW